MRDNVIPKFRAFLIEAKTMRDVVEIDFVKNMYCLQMGRSTIREWFWYRDLFLMQSTGLKDKNGVEIYEGDIFRFGDRNYVVIYNLGSFGCFEDDKYFPLGEIFYRNGEVIGNIYENPELLEREAE